MDEVKLYRRRFIPDEKILLKDDVIISLDEKRVVTKWNVLTKRHDFTHGSSCYFIDKGWKISKFLDENDNLVYWYCDIIETERNEEENSYTFNDLLIDVIIHPDKRVEVVDIDEVAQALREDIISKELVIKALDRLNALLGVIYSGDFDKYSTFAEV
jgi:predicted RNA-binding protein associated with RNAse of E/G family